MDRDLFRHRRHSRHGRPCADHAGLHAAPRPCGRPGAARRTESTADRADRQGHAHFRLHDRVGARGRLRLGGRRRRAAPARCRRPASPTSRARCVLSLGRRHQRLAQPVRRQRHQVLLRAGQQAAGRAGSSRSRPRWATPAAVGRFGAARQGAAPRRRRRPLHRVLQEHLRQRPVAEGPEDRRRCARTAPPTTSRRTSSTSWAPRSSAIGCEPDGININAGFGATAPEALVEAVREQRRRLRHRAGRRRRPAAARRCAGAPLQRRRVALPDGRRPPGSRAWRVPGVGRHADDQHGGRAGAWQPRRRHSSRQGRRPLRARGAGGARLAAGRRRLRPPARARQAHHRRRHRQRAAGAAGDRPQRQVARRAARAGVGCSRRR